MFLASITMFYFQKPWILQVGSGLLTRRVKSTHKFHSIVFGTRRLSIIFIFQTLVAERHGKLEMIPGLVIIYSVQERWGSFPGEASTMNVQSSLCKSSRSTRSK